MIRILHIVGAMDRGGAETFIMNIYRHIDRSRVQFDFAVHTARPGHYDEEIISLGGRILPLPRPHLWGLPKYRKAFMELLQRHGPFGGVHSHVHFFSGYTLRLAHKAGVPLRIAHSHNTSDGRGDALPRRIYRRLMRYSIYQNATLMLGCSPPACEALFGRDCWSDKRVQVFHYAIDLEPYASLPKDRNLLRAQLGLPLTIPLIGHVGRFDVQKNHRFLIEVFAALLQRLPDAHLVLVGGGPLRPEVEKQIAQKGLKDKVSLLGVRSDIPQIMGCLDLFLFPSLWEGVPLTLIEAQAAGVPCVVSNRVPRDVDLGLGVMRFVDLDEGMDCWIRTILEMLHMNRPGWAQREQALVSAGYEARCASQILEEIYAGCGQA